MIDFHCVKHIMKPWGYEKWFGPKDNYLFKEIYIRGGTRTSLQYHRYKDETIRVTKGTGKVIFGSTEEELEERIYETGWVFHISPGTIHRIEAWNDTVLLEVSTPEHDDVVRLQDDSGRA
jgi:mannose-6-phosphate isomerase